MMKQKYHYVTDSETKSNSHRGVKVRKLLTEDNERIVANYFDDAGNTHGMTVSTVNGKCRISESKVNRVGEFVLKYDKPCSIAEANAKLLKFYDEHDTHTFSHNIYNPLENGDLYVVEQTTYLKGQSTPIPHKKNSPDKYAYSPQTVMELLRSTNSTPYTKDKLFGHRTRAPSKKRTPAVRVNVRKMF